MKGVIYIVFTLLILYSPVQSHAQLQGLRFKHLTEEQGLSNNSYNSFVFEDSRGLVWISSLNGIYRFDGEKADHYDIPTSQDNPSPSQNIQSSFWEDQQSNLWFTSFSALHCYDRLVDSIKSFTINDRGDVLNSNYHVFYLDRESDLLWLKAGDNIFTYHISTEKYSPPIYQSNAMRFTVDTTLHGKVDKIYGCLWWNGPGVEVAERINAWKPDIIDHGYLGKINVSKAVLSPDKKTLWLSSTEGLIEYNINKQAAQIYKTKNDEFSCWDLTYWPDQKQLVVATHNYGLWSFDTYTKTFTSNLLKNEDFSFSLSSDSPLNVFSSITRQLWISHNNIGLDYNIPHEQSFSNPVSELPKESAVIKRIFKDNNDLIWLLLESGTLFTFDKNEHLVDITDSKNITNNGNPFTLLSYDDNDGIWAIESNRIFFRNLAADTNSNQWELRYEGNEMIRSLLQIDSNYWMTNTSGVYHFDNETPIIPIKSLLPASFNFDQIFQADGLLFIPYQSSSLWIGHIENSDISILHQFDQFNTDTYDVMASQFSDTVWIATEKGVFAYSNYTLSPLLTSRNFGEACSIYTVIEDVKGHLWLSSNRGLWKYNKQTNELFRFGKADGLVSESFIPGAALQTQNGKIWLGTDQGLVVFHPDSVKTDFPRPKAHIEALWVNNVPYETDYAISEMPLLALNYQENTLAFELRAVGFYQPENSRLNYQLLGYDDRPVSIENGGFARFTQIPPGEYTLLITPVNAHGQAGVAKRLPIRIRPPFWQTWWFKILSVLSGILLIISIVGAYYRRKLQQQKRLIEKQEALNEERNRIAKELHDDMGSSLSSILYLSDDLLIDMEGKETEQEVQRIGELAVSSLENMREIIWAMDTSNNSFQDLSQRLQKLTENLLSDNKLDFTLDFPVVPHNPTLGAALRRNIYLIVKESLHNTIKHAQAKHVKIALQLRDQSIYLNIQDDGIGFDQQALQEQGYGLNNMQERAAAIDAQLIINSKPNEGTHLMLSVSW